MARFKEATPLGTLVNHPVHGNVGTLAALRLIVPPLPVSSLHPLLGGLLPIREHNDDLLQGLELLPPSRIRQQFLFSVFAADPFIEGKQLVRRLFDKGCRRVINWPTTAQHGIEFSTVLDGVDLGPRQEYKSLRTCAQRGLAISLTVCGADAAPAIAQLEPEMVFLAPTFDLWASGKMRHRELLHRCAELARVVRDQRPIVLMAARGVLSLAEARRAGASGLLSM